MIRGGLLAGRRIRPKDLSGHLGLFCLFGLVFALYTLYTLVCALRKAETRSQHFDLQISTCHQLFILIHPP